MLFRSALVEQKKRISIEDAAKSLNLSPVTVENLAAFLEEEKLLGIRYQFTTPYLEWKEAKEAPLVKKEVKLQAKLVESPAAKVIEGQKPSMIDAKAGLQQAHALLSQGKVTEAKELYRQIHELYDALPTTYLATKKEIEQDLVKLNTELTIIVDRNAAAKVTENKAKIEGLLDQGQKLLKSNEIKTAIKTYNEIKSLYRSLPLGFVKEKTELAEKVLTFYEQLTLANRESSKKEFTAKYAEVNTLIDNLRSAMNVHKLSEATKLYNKAKEKYSELPHGFYEEKLGLQERLITIYRDITVSKRTISVSESREKSDAIDRFIDQINDCLSKNELEKAVLLYKEVRALYVGMPQGFQEQNEIHDNIIKTYKRLIKAKREYSISSIKFSGGKISDLLNKAKYYVSSKQTDLAFQLYYEIIDEYNLLPEGYDKDKAMLRDNVYNLYYDLISSADIAQLGTLDDYTRHHYFGLLKLLVTVHKVIDSQEFQLLPEIYGSIHRLYNELPLKVIQQNVKLVQEVNRVYSLMKIYEAIENLDKFSKEKNMDEMRETLSFLGVAIVKAGRDSPEDSTLLKYAKDRYIRYTELYEGRSSEIPPYIPQFTKKPQLKSFADLQKQAEPSMQKSTAQYEMPFRFKSPKSKENAALAVEEEKLYAEVASRRGILHKRETEIRGRMDHLSKCKELFELAKQNMADKNYNEALIELGKLLTIDPRYPNARELRAQIEKIKMEEYRGELLASLVKGKKEKALTRLVEHDYDGAINYINSILELDPSNVEARYMLQTAKSEKAGLR